MNSARIAKSLGMMLAGMFFISGCTQDSPVAPTNEQWSTAQMSAPAPSLDVQVSSLTRVVWPVPNQPTTDTLSSSVCVTPAKGGKVRVKWSNYDANHKKTSTVSFTMTIPAGAVSSPQTISINVDKNSPQISAEFGPSGLVFNTPLLLTVQATGIDMSAFNATDHIDLWYVNSTGWVSAMQYSKFKFDTRKGTLDVKDIQIPHFSRYCFGR
ncbi:MAG TPA: hypothetical protein VMG09_07205 [Bacteroidota bacterium]|nr:hypothetical protein [Bacteroidota bacterium]